MVRIVAIVVAAACALAGGCTIAARTSTGGATAQPGVEPGTTRSIYLADRGGLLTRLGVAGLGAAAAVGSVSNVQSTSRVIGTTGTADIVETTTTGTVNVAAAQRAQDLIDSASDWNNELKGLTGGLEIASRDLGGDTSGWMFDFGGVGTVPFSDTSRFALRWSGKLKFGKMTFHERTKRVAMDTSVIETAAEDQTFAMFGFPLRAGIAYRGFIEAFFQADINTITMFNELVGEPASPSPWHTGLRASIKYVYVEAEIAWSAFREDNKSIGLEAGIAF